MGRWYNYILSGTLQQFKSIFITYKNDDVKRKKYNYKTVIECGKKMSKYIDWVKKDLFGCFRMEDIRDKDNETGLKEGGGIEIETTVLQSRAALSLFVLLTCIR